MMQMGAHDDVPKSHELPREEKILRGNSKSAALHQNLGERNRSSFLHLKFRGRLDSGNSAPEQMAIDRQIPSSPSVEHL
jgi:hypothetical protein